MNILALETSSPVLSVALQKGKTGKILQSSVRGFSKHAENLFPALDQLLKKTKLSIQEIDTWLIGRGPGSFTGLRIGFSALKGFLVMEKSAQGGSASGGKDCFGALSLDLIAENAPLPEGSRLGVCLDAFRQKVYARFYRRSQGKWQPASTPEAWTLEEFISRLPPETALTGNALERFGPEIKKHFQKIHFLTEKLWYPKASSLISLFQARDKKI
ncbi:MAG TPA: tRNA (adenosine(37)-N6)-threonylcarbamoyltransferase complex dimerization subunit type 1 TsaB, partial [bacterium]|nr:tRNA (adenosine(37)-N6)-threonylcarbamoyltransferase complex dimerization subunit type 1 TsaB [bacterium]